MSWQAVDWVLSHSPAEHSQRLVLVVLAERANKDGTRAIASIATLMQRTRLSKGAVTGALAWLRQNGCIERTGTAAGYKHANVYRVILARSDSGHPQNVDGPDSGVRPVQNRGDASPDSGPNPSGESEEDPPTSASEGDRFASNNGTPTDEVLRILATCERLVVDGSARLQVESAVQANGGWGQCDPVAAAHEAVAAAAHPTWNLTAVGRLMSHCLRKQAERGGSQTRTADAGDRALRNLLAKSNGHMPNAGAYNRHATCPDCKQPFENDPNTREFPGSARCDMCTEKWESRSIEGTAA